MGLNEGRICARRSSVDPLAGAGYSQSPTHSLRSISTRRGGAGQELMMKQSAAIAPGRLSPSEYGKNFDEAKPPLESHQALVDSSRCLFCYDAPCIEACPTGID